jgi:hypothetical protein
MRALPKVVVLSSLLLCGAALAGSGDQKSPAPPKGPATGSAAAPTPALPPETAPVDPNSVKPEDMPTAVRMRRIEQRTQALKERAWQLKARVQTLKEQMLGGGVGAQALISHENEMGSSFHLVKLTYTLDGTQIFARTDDSGENLFKTKSFDIFTGPISPGNHQLAMVATYKGHGYGVFEYLSKFTFTARNQSSFVSGEGKISRVECRGFEKGGASTPMEKRAAIDCKVTDVAPDKPADAQKATTPGNTPMPAATPPAVPAPTAPPAGK